MNIKLNIKSIIKFEQFCNKSFNEIDYTDTDDLMKLLYCIVLSNNDEKFNYNEFLELVNSKKISKEIRDKFNKIMELIGYFSIDLKNEVDTEISTEKETIYIKDIASLLIVNAGINPEYVMNEMDINDISIFMNAYNNKVKEQMESSRLWCYLSILPHIDSSKINNPTKFYSFPWELEKLVNTEKEDLNNMANELPEIFKASVELIEKINKQKL